LTWIEREGIPDPDFEHWDFRTQSFQNSILWAKKSQTNPFFFFGDFFFSLLVGLHGIISSANSILRESWVVGACKEANLLCGTYGGGAEETKKLKEFGVQILIVDNIVKLSKKNM
jgi:hypothetical protein